MKIALVGNPNTGKSTLINALTGSSEKTGNWPGVTIEKKTGFFRHEGETISITDLPGTDGLNFFPHSTSPGSLEEKITSEFILHEKIDLIIQVIDASRIERQLYLTSQLLETGVPILIALNKMDMVKKHGFFINEKKLADALGCPVVSIIAHKKKGIPTLKNQIVKLCKEPKKILKSIHFPTVIENSIYDLSSQLLLPESLKRAATINLLENPQETESKELMVLRQSIEHQLGMDLDVMIASTRYDFAHKIATDSISKTTHSSKFLSNLLDHIFLNRFLGIPLFLAIMYGLFFVSIRLGKVFQNFFEILGEALFVKGSAYGLSQLAIPKWLIIIVSEGIGKGITTTLSFIPVLITLFLALSFLEMSGYMARAAFIMDRLMKVIGLSGKSFIPLMIGFGCNVPAIMAARTLSNEKDRTLTIMMTPFMSCGARFAIYSVFVTAFFKDHGENIIFILYLTGILMAILTAWLLKKRLPGLSYEYTVIEIPDYHWPSFNTWIQLSFQRLKSFLLRAGSIIVPVSMLIYLLNAITLDGSINFQSWQPNSILAQLGKTLTPLLQPIGIHEDNWPATVGLLSGILAKEVVIGTLNTLYSQSSTIISYQPPVFDLWESVRQAFTSIQENWSQLQGGVSILSDEKISTAKAFHEHFNDKTSAFAYLLFTLLYIPCVSTFAVIAKELNRKWAFISIIWSTGLAYSTAVLFYQIATLPLHIVTSCIWILLIFLLLALTLFSINKMVQLRMLSQ